MCVLGLAECRADIVVSYRQQGHGALLESVTFGWTRIEIMLRGFAPPSATGAPAKVAQITSVALFVGVHRVASQIQESFGLKNGQKPILENIAEKDVGPVIGVAGKRLTRRLDVEILPQSTSRDRMVTVLDEFHWVRVSIERFGCGRLVPVLSPPQREQRAESDALTDRSSG